MIEVERWRRERSEPDMLRCVPLDGSELGEIVVCERQRPLARYRILIDEQFPEREATGPVQRLVTLEGELATISSFTVRGSQHVFGVVYGDDFQTTVHGVTRYAKQRQRIESATHELVCHFPLGLGDGRLQRYRYQAPSGWRGVMSGLVTDWFPRDTHDPSTIRVLPARPHNVATLRLHSFFHDDDFSDVAIDKLERTAIPHESVKGTLTRVTSGDRVFLTAGLETRRHLYIMRLVTTTAWLAASELAFMKLIGSCVPIAPRASIRRPSLPSSVMAYWAI